MFAAGRKENKLITQTNLNIITTPLNAISEK